MNVKTGEPLALVSWPTYDAATMLENYETLVADTNAPLEERRIGGLGIHLVRNIMDSVKYEYSEGKNILTMIKNI